MPRLAALAGDARLRRNLAHIPRAGGTPLLACVGHPACGCLCLIRALPLPLPPPLPLTRCVRPLPPPPACRGTDYGVPFEAPLDYLIPVAQLDAYGVAYRHSSFLQHPQVRQQVRAVCAAASPVPPTPAPISQISRA